MPHLSLEYTANLAEVFDVPAALREANAALLATGLIDSPVQMKSRATQLEHYRVGNFDEGEAFIHARLHLMAGRSIAQRRQLGAALVTALQSVLAPAAGLRVQITVEFTEMLLDTYQKLVIEP
ncbi:MAG: 5-carboxymethyl-2-hydroxymuconate Delta-isomerase [Rhodocyclaceae bacterium]